MYVCPYVHIYIWEFPRIGGPPYRSQKFTTLLKGPQKGTPSFWETFIHACMYWESHRQYVGSLVSLRCGCQTAAGFQTSCFGLAESTVGPCIRRLEVTMETAWLKGMTMAPCFALDYSTQLILRGTTVNLDVGNYTHQEDQT